MKKFGVYIYGIKKEHFAHIVSGSENPETMFLVQGKETRNVARFIKFSSVIINGIFVFLVREDLIQCWNSLAYEVVWESSTWTSPTPVSATKNYLQTHTMSDSHTVI